MHISHAVRCLSRKVTLQLYVHIRLLELLEVSVMSASVAMKTEQQVFQGNVEAEFAKLDSPNHLAVRCIHGALSWKGDPNDITFQAASNATFKVHGKRPDMTREGGSIPVTLDFVVNTGKPACLLPVGASDDGAHSQNEKFDLINMQNGIKTMALTLHEYANLWRSEKNM